MTAANFRTPTIFLAFGCLMLSVACARSGTTNQEADATATAQSRKFRAEGTVDGGGGKGVMCGSRLITLDRFEAERDFGVTSIQLDSSSLDAALLDLSERLVSQTSTYELLPRGQWDSGLETKLLNSWKTELIGQRLQSIAPGSRLAATADATLPNLPADCYFTQIAVYDFNGIIHYDPEYMAMLDWADVAVLYAHEYFYSLYRRNGERTSDGTRKLVAFALANRLKPMFQNMWNAKKLVSCFGGGGQTSRNQVFEFYLVEAAGGGLDVYFRGLGRALTFTETRTHFHGVTTAEFLSGQWAPTSLIAAEDFFGHRWIVELEPQSDLTHGRDFFSARAYQVGETTNETAAIRCREENQKEATSP